MYDVTVSWHHDGHAFTWEEVESWTQIKESNELVLRGGSIVEAHVPLEGARHWTVREHQDRKRLGGTAGVGWTEGVSFQPSGAGGRP